MAYFYPSPSPWHSYPALIKIQQGQPPSSKIPVTMIISPYFQWFTGYLKHVDLLMSHVHVLKKLPHCLICI